MKLPEAIKILEYHNRWRRGDEEEYIATPKKLGVAIDLVLKEVKVKSKRK